MQFRIPTPSWSPSRIKVKVLPADIPLLLGLNVLDNEKLVANNVLNELQVKHHGWSMPLTHKHEQLYLTWISKLVQFTRS